MIQSPNFIYMLDHFIYTMSWTQQRLHVGFKKVTALMKSLFKDHTAVHAKSLNGVEFHTLYFCTI
jgi:hypothetical protein